MKVLACPKCGKLPVISNKNGLHYMKCKPMIGRAHLIVCIALDEYDYEEELAEEWNKAVKEEWGGEESDA